VQGLGAARVTVLLQRRAELERAHAAADLAKHQIERLEWRVLE
jgi:hypothetical protein